MLQVRVFKAASLVARPSKVGGIVVWARGGARHIVLTLRLQAVCPFLHHLLREELDGKVFDTRIAFPPDLDAVRAWLGKRHDISHVGHENSALELQLGIPVLLLWE